MGPPRDLLRIGRIGWVVLLALATGCVGYVMGWSDAEVERLRRVVAELEAKNATLAEEVIELRAALRGAGKDGSGARGPEEGERQERSRARPTPAASPNRLGAEP